MKHKVVEELRKIKTEHGGEDIFIDISRFSSIIYDRLRGDEMDAEREWLVIAAKLGAYSRLKNASLSGDIHKEATILVNILHTNKQANIDFAEEIIGYFASLFTDEKLMFTRQSVASSTPLKSTSQITAPKPVSPIQRGTYSQIPPSSSMPMQTPAPPTSSSAAQSNTTIRRTKKEREWWLVPFIILEFALLGVTIFISDRLELNIYFLLPVFYIVMNIINFLILMVKKGETLTGFLKSNTGLLVIRAIILFILILAGLLSTNIPASTRWVWTILQLVFLVFIFWAVFIEWKNNSKGFNSYGVIMTIWIALAMLANTYFPNISARPINAITNLVVGRSVMGEVYYEERGFLGIYSTTGNGRYVSNYWIYEGEFVNGDFNGIGKVTWEDGVVYEGEFINNNFNGRGTMIWPDGTRYEGDYADDKRHGNGTYHYSDGSWYEGEWANGERHGQGTMTEADGSVKSGHWENNQFIE